MMNEVQAAAYGRAEKFDCGSEGELRLRNLLFCSG